MKQITVIIPCYNEENAIASVIGAFPRQQLLAHGFKLDILVVDNNSTDKTVKIAKAAGARVIRETRQGKGYALRAGFASLTKKTDYVAMLDGDDTYKPQEILRLIEPINSGFAQVIIGSRLQGRIRVGSMKKLNHLGNRVYSRLVRSTYHVAVSDVLTGYFAWDRTVIEKLAPYLQSSGFAIEMEMITKMARLGYPIYSVPVSYDPRLGATNLHPVRDGARILRMYARNITWQPATLTAPVEVIAVQEAVETPARSRIQEHADTTAQINVAQPAAHRTVMPFIARPRRTATAFFESLRRGE